MTGNTAQVLDPRSDALPVECGTCRRSGSSNRSSRGTLDANVGVGKETSDCDEGSDGSVTVTSGPVFRRRLMTSGLGSSEPKLKVRGEGVLGSKNVFGGLRVDLRLLSDRGAT